MPNAFAIRATCWPTRPSPMIPSVLPCSTGVDGTGHSPLRTAASLAGIWRITAVARRDGQFGRADRVAGRRLRDDDAALARGGKVDVVGVIARLGDEAHVRQLAKQLARERVRSRLAMSASNPRSAAGSPNGAVKIANLRPFAQPPNAFAALPRVVDVVENRDSHASTVFMRGETAASSRARRPTTAIESPHTSRPLNSLRTSLPGAAPAM